MAASTAPKPYESVYQLQRHSRIFYQSSLRRRQSHFLQHVRISWDTSMLSLRINCRIFASCQSSTNHTVGDQSPTLQYCATHRQTCLSANMRSTGPNRAVRYHVLTTGLSMASHLSMPVAYKHPWGAFVTKETAQMPRLDKHSDSISSSQAPDE
jgi:hypothetical protein